MDDLDTLLAKAGSFDDLRKFFTTDERIKDLCAETTREIVENGCYSASAVMIATIEKLLDK